MSVVSDLKGLGDSQHGSAALYIFMFGLLLSDVLPTPGDAAFFSYTRKLRDQYMNKEITPKQYWDRTALGYYFFNALWWIILFAIVVAVKGTGTKMKVLLALLGGGAVVAVIFKNIKKDELAQALATEATIPKQ